MSTPASEAQAKKAKKKAKLNPVNSQLNKGLKKDFKKMKKQRRRRGNEDLYTFDKSKRLNLQYSCSETILLRLLYVFVYFLLKLPSFLTGLFRD